MDNFLQPFAVGAVGDLARNAAAARGVGHKHGKAPGERKIGGERRPFVAALFLDDLHQKHLAALDHFLNFILSARAGGAVGNFLHRIAADMFDVIRLVVMLVFVVVVRRGLPTGLFARAILFLVALVLAPRLDFVILLGRLEYGVFRRSRLRPRRNPTGRSKSVRPPSRRAAPPKASRPRAVRRNLERRPRLAASRPGPRGFLGASLGPRKGCASRSRASAENPSESRVSTPRGSSPRASNGCISKP